MIAVNIRPDLEARLSELSVRTGKPRDFYVEEAVLALLEDLEDARMADEVAGRDEPSYPLEQVRRELGLDN